MRDFFGGFWRNLSLGGMGCSIFGDFFTDVGQFSKVWQLRFGPFRINSLFFSWFFFCLHGFGLHWFGFSASHGFGFGFIR